MGFLSVLGFVHTLVEERVKPGDTVIDATAGGGNDTLFLARCVGAEGRVYAFDIQEEALQRTARRLEAAADRDALGQVELLLQSHHRMAECLPPELAGRVAAVMFNLGYLPGSDHAVITTTRTTIPALQAACDLLRPGGVLTVVVYTGHEGGQAEAGAVEQWAMELPQTRYQALVYRFVNQRNHPPYVIAIEKRA